jgi:hypothetical protein
MESPIEEEELTEAAAFDSLEKLLRNDLVGIDVGSIHNGNGTSMLLKCFHDGMLYLF